MPANQLCDSGHGLQDSLYMYMYMYVRLVSLGWDSDSLETAVLCAPVYCESLWFSELLLLFFPPSLTTGCILCHKRFSEGLCSDC